MRLQVKAAVAAVPIALCLPPNPVLGSGTFPQVAPLVELATGWEYRWGDSPRDQQGRFLWSLEDSTAVGWDPAETLARIPGRDRRPFLWLRRKLPDMEIPNPMLFLPPAQSSFEAYLDGTRIYGYGEMARSPRNKYVLHSFIPLAQDFPGKYLTLRIFSPPGDEIGLQARVHKPLLSSEARLVKTIIQRNIDGVILGIFFIFAGTVAILIFIRRKEQRHYFYLSFALFTVSVGVFLCAADVITQPFVSDPAWRFYLTLGGLFIFPVGLFSFFEQIVGAGRKSIVRRLWQFHLLFAVVLLAGLLLNLFPSAVARYTFMVTILVTTLTILYTSVMAALRGNVEAKLFNAGFVLLGLSGIHDVLLELGVIPDWHWLFPWGTFAFILVLGFILERRFNENTLRLQQYSKELEEYSQTLEQRVEARTRELQEAQNQLILKEKMASLGNLVAGIAHEVNTPVGAVNSAADVSARCIARISQAVEESKTIAELKENKLWQKSLALLKENNQIILTASRRIVHIVRSLRNFARLDEAEFQKADIHEGLDSTLTLLHHQLKNRVEVVKDYGQLPRIECFPNQLNQVFMNLLVNAAQAIQGKGRITIKTRADDAHVRIQISDTGKGIPRENLNNIFDPGFTTKGVGVGTGLGLSISYNIIQKHHGEISVKSEVGKGTEFTIRLPVAQEKNAAAAQ